MHTRVPPLRENARTALVDDDARSSAQQTTCPPREPSRGRRKKKMQRAKWRRICAEMNADPAQGKHNKPFARRA